jgi:hypothetical protein
MPRTTAAPATIGVTRHPELDDRMSACLQISDVDGRQWVIDLDIDDIKRLYCDLRMMLQDS